MNDENELNNFGDNYLSPIVDPFNKTSITEVSLNMRIPLFSDNFVFEGRVNFTNGSTDGTQRFKAENMDALYLKVSEFVKKLE